MLAMIQFFTCVLLPSMIYLLDDQWDYAYLLAISMIGFNIGLVALRKNK